MLWPLSLLIQRTEGKTHFPAFLADRAQVCGLAQPIRCTHIGLGFQGEKSKEADIPRIILWWRWLDVQQQQRWHFWYPVPSITVVTHHVGGP